MNFLDIRCMIAVFLLVLFIIIFQFIQLEYSCLRSFCRLRLKLATFITNIILLSILTSTIQVFAHNLIFALFISSLIVTVWSIFNTYVVLFHGSPLLPYELLNIPTVTNILSGYRFSIDSIIILILSLFLGELGFVYILKYILIFSSVTFVDASLIFSIIVLLMLLLVAYLLLFKKRGDRIIDIDICHWGSSIRDKGYILYLVSAMKKYLCANRRVSRYQTSNIYVPTLDFEELTSEKTDVIMILNESFFDLDEYCPLLNNNFFSDLLLIPNVTSGKAIALFEGTNDSEYEFLTGNTILLSKTVPFNYMDFTKNSQANAVSYFNSLGYHKSAVHWGNPMNYRRATVYKQLGFDEIILGKKRYTYDTYFGNRRHLDIDDYHQLIDVYNNNSEKSQFIFCVTYQNHGGYSQNSDDMNTVQITKNLGKITHETNEYLSSVKHSVEAFKFLTQYFSKIEKRVIICMVGDHKPALVDQLPIDRYESEDSAQIAKHLVPYYLWSNFEYEAPENNEYASITDLLPMSLKAAKLPLSPWYQQILNLHKYAPARYFNNTYLDKNGNVCTFNESKIAEKELLNYYAMASNNIRGGKGFREDIFRPSNLNS